MSIGSESANKAIAFAYTSYRIELGTYYDDYTDSVYERVWLVLINDYMLPEVWFDVESQALKFIEELAYQDAACTDRRVTVDMIDKSILLVAPRNVWHTEWESKENNLVRILSKLAIYTYEQYWKDAR